MPASLNASQNYALDLAIDVCGANFSSSSNKKLFPNSLNTKKNKKKSFGLQDSYLFHNVIFKQIWLKFLLKIPYQKVLIQNAIYHNQKNKAISCYMQNL